MKRLRLSLSRLAVAKRSPPRHPKNRNRSPGSSSFAVPRRRTTPAPRSSHRSPSEAASDPQNARRTTVQRTGSLLRQTDDGRWHSQRDGYCSGTVTAVGQLRSLVVRISATIGSPVRVNSGKLKGLVNSTDCRFSRSIRAVARPGSALFPRGEHSDYHLPSRCD